MKSYTFVLSSDQKQSFPSILNHYLFEDPVYGISFTYPNTANGSFFHTTTGSFTYPVTANGGLVFPWGYVVQTIRTNLTAGPFKGPYTINFSPSGIDTRYFNVLKIIYDFNNGEEIYTVEKDIVPNLRERFLQTKNPTEVTPGRVYYPGRDITTYHPIISVINGNLTQNIYNISFSMVPESIYEHNSLKVLNSIQPGMRSLETLGMFEIEKSDFVTNARILSTADTKYSEGLVFTPKQYGDLVVWLDASESLSLERDNAYRVQLWQDKSGYDNHFYQKTTSNKPTFVYAKQSSASRKGIRFAGDLSQDVDKKYFTCINNTAFNSITGGYTVVMVLHPGALSGTLITQTSSANNPRNNLSISFAQPFGVSLTQGLSDHATVMDNLTLNLSSYNLFTFTVLNSATLQASFDSFTLDIPNQTYAFGNNNANITIGPLLSSEISEILVYNTPLPAATLDKLKADLVSKWGITYRTD
jgi:hypothetical protein